jgi:hypothetical protein
VSTATRSRHTYRYLYKWRVFVISRREQRVDACPMSVRVDELADYVTVRGTSVSTSLIAPSLLHVSVVQTFGMPNQHGMINCDGHVLHLRYDLRNANLVHVWAQPDAVGAHEPQSTCALL